MFTVAKLVFVIILQLNLFLIAGCLMVNAAARRTPCSFSMTCAIGFAAWHAFFWLLSFPWTLLKWDFKPLCAVWGGLTLFLILLALNVKRTRNALLDMYRRLFKAALKYWPFVLAALLLVGFTAYYVTVAGFLDIDSQTYIAELTTIVDTNKIGLYNPATGRALSRRDFLHRGCSMFGAESAFWCAVFKIRPLLYCRYIRAAMDPLLLSTGTYGVARKLGAKTERAFIFVMLSCAGFFLFDNSGYTNMRFMMHRGYEGKAYLTGVLLVFTVLCCAYFLERLDLMGFIVLFLNELATLSISASSLFIIPPLVLAVCGGFFIARKKWKMLPVLLIVMVPNLAFTIMNVVG